MPSPDELAQKLTKRNRTIKQDSAAKKKRRTRVKRTKPKSKPSLTSADRRAELNANQRRTRKAIRSRQKRGVAGEADKRLAKREGLDLSILF